VPREVPHPVWPEEAEQAYWRLYALKNIPFPVGAGPLREMEQPQGVVPAGDADVGAGPCACPGQPQELGQPQGVAPTLGLPDVVHRFKTMTTKRYADGVKRLGWEPFRGRLWQRNYYEHIIRNEESLNRIREYILTNPMRWELDRENPHRVGVDEFDTWLNSVGKENNGETNARRQPHRQLAV